MTDTSRPVETEAIHGFFGLTYASYLVLPRVLLQSMSDEWQSQFVRLIEQYDDAFRHVEQAPAYDVIPGREVEYRDLTKAEMKQIGASVEEPDYDDDPDGTPTYYDKDAVEHEGWHRAIVPVADPLPSYNRGRTRIPRGAAGGQS